MKHFLTVLKYVLLLSISGALMWYAMRGLKWDDIMQAIRKANYWWLGLTMGLSVLGYLSRAYRWKMQLTASRHRVEYWPGSLPSWRGTPANIPLDALKQ